MTFVRDPEDTGFLVRLVKIYREKRAPVPMREYFLEELRPVQVRMPRRSAWQIAWRQARNAQGVR